MSEVELYVAMRNTFRGFVEPGLEGVMRMAGLPEFPLRDCAVQILCVSDVDDPGADAAVLGLRPRLISLNSW